VTTQVQGFRVQSSIVGDDICVSSKQQEWINPEPVHADMFF
jgi:hypothetical protein